MSKMLSYRDCVQVLAQLGNPETQSPGVTPLPFGDHDHDNLNKQTCHDHDPKRWAQKTHWRLVDKDETMKAAKRWGVYRETLFHYLQLHGYDLVKEKIELVGKIPQVTNRAAYLARALQNMS